jgi:hypothetical protein
MADNVAFQDADPSTPPNNTIIATDNIAGINYQRVKVTWGADGTANDASSSTPLPVDIAFQTTKALTNASVSASSSGDNTLVSGTAAQTIRVYKLVLVAASAVSVTLKDGASTSLTGAIPLTANGALTVDASDGEPEFVTSSGNGFVLNLSGAFAVTGWIQYTKS